MVGTTVGIAYPGLYHLVTHAALVLLDHTDWYVDTKRCVEIRVVGLPWALPTTWAIVPPPKLPPCLTLNPATGQICGTAMQVGVTTVTVTATDATGQTISLAVTITVRPKP